MNLLEEAQRYLAAGLRPIPVRQREKAPAVAWQAYQERAPTKAELEQWFADDGRNIGTAIPSGWIVVDFDGGKEAEALLVAAGVSLPTDAPKVRSGSGGYHVYMRLPDNVRDFPKIPGPKFLSTGGGKPFVEVLTAGNFVVLPPSVHPNGRPYEWVIELEAHVPPVPPTFLALCKRPSRQNGNAPGWVEELSRGVPYGQIDDSIAKLAGYYIGRGLTVFQVIDILDTGFNARCTKDGTPYRTPAARLKEVVESIARSHARGAGDCPYISLGYDHGQYFYFSRPTGQVVTLSARAHDGDNLLMLADLRYWESKYGGERGVVWRAAQAKLLDDQHKIGVFDPERFRGRGAWWDGELGAVMHTGERLLIGDRTVPIRDAPSGRHVYELARAMDAGLGDPIGAGTALPALFSLLPWEHPQDARLMAGWCAVAAVCGAVEWRPHVWLTGPSGAGKSWIVANIIRPLLGNLALMAQSTTTEAGLRQALGHDARPVIFDEAETDGHRDDLRMANVLGLARQSSSDTGGSILKGTVEGRSRTYLVRSCFLMSSINVSAHLAADRNRISVLELRPNLDEEQVARDAAFSRLCLAITSLLTPAFCAGFRARCLRSIPVIRESARVLSLAASGAVGSRRLGDQMGTLMAGYWSLLSDSPASGEDAATLLGGHDLSEQREMAASGTDERDLLARLLQSVIRFQTQHGPREASVAHLAALASEHEQQLEGPTAREATDALSLAGFKVKAEGLLVANSHVGVRRLLEGTPWSREWGRVLKRLVGVTCADVARIGAVTCRCVVVPWDLIG